MADRITKEQRSKIMSQIRSKDTKPERRVRSLLHSMGYRFRLQRKELPGTPDIVLPKYRTVILVHGCFWHRHRGCKYCKTPSSNKSYWTKKFTRNTRRDIKQRKMLEQNGWKVSIIWECETEDERKLLQSIIRIFSEQ